MVTLANGLAQTMPTGGSTPTVHIHCGQVYKLGLRVNCHELPEYKMPLFVLKLPTRSAPFE